MPSFILAILVASLIVVLGSEQTVPYDKLFTRVPTEEPLYDDTADSPLTWDIDCDETDTVPSTCFAVQNGNRCSCKILDKKWVMVLSGCVNPHEDSQIKVYAGASNDKDASQRVSATVFSAPKPPPLDVLFLHLQTALNQTYDVHPAYLTAAYVNDKFGYVSGYRYEKNGGYHSKCYNAHILDGICNSDEICAFEREKNSWPALTHDKATDFLDYFDENTGYAFLLGVRAMQQTDGFIAYHRILMMFPWMEKYLGSISVAAYKEFRIPVPQIPGLEAGIEALIQHSG